MKKFVFCIQNDLIEDSLRESKIIGNDSHLIFNNKDLNLEYLDRINPDFIMFPHWSYKVPKEIFTKYKCVCFHSTPLPYGRGGSPLQNMISKGHKETEVCSLLMVEEFDAGPIYLRTKISLEGTIHEILKRVYKSIADQMKILMNKDIEPSEQSGEIVNFTRLSQKDNHIDFNSSKDVIYDKIRMLDSHIYPSSYLEIGEYKIEFSKATLKNGTLEARVLFQEINKNE